MANQEGASQRAEQRQEHSRARERTDNANANAKTNGFITRQERETSTEREGRKRGTTTILSALQSAPPSPTLIQHQQHNMQLSTLIPMRWRRSHRDKAQAPGVYARTVTPWIHAVSRNACTHPIYTIAAVMMVCSGLYAKLLDTGFFHPAPAVQGLTPDSIDVSALSVGSRRLHLTPINPSASDANAKWTLEEVGAEHHTMSQQGNQDMVVVTLVFPNTAGLSSSPNGPPTTSQIAALKDDRVTILPSNSPLALGPLPVDPSLVFAMPSDHVSRFLDAVTQLSPSGDASTPADEESDDDEHERPRWTMQLGGSKREDVSGILDWVRNAWSAFIDLIQHAETLDIVIMALGYLSMYLTFASLFLSMKRMGSNFWLATTVLLSSAFAFLFGIIVTMRLGVPENIVLLSEGVPFLVVTVGFEKPIVLTQAVLSAAIHGKTNNDATPPTIQNAVHRAVQERGFEIVRDYLIEILVLCVGAASGIQGGLRQFCFLAAWTLFFDCILLFTFYISILTIKLEINRIKRHVALRKALEEEGVSRRVAENVASSNDWPRDDTFSPLQSQ